METKNVFNSLSSKELSLIHNAGINETKTSLAGAVKMYCKLFNSAKEISEVMKKNGITYNPAALQAICALAKDKEEVLRICSALLPSVDGIFIQYVVSERYIRNNEGEKVIEFTRSSEYIEEKAVKGFKHKGFSAEYPNLYANTKPCAWYLTTSRLKDGITIYTTTIAIKRTTFNIKLVAKAVEMYLSFDDKDTLRSVIAAVNKYNTECLAKAREVANVEKSAEQLKAEAEKPEK